MHRERKRVPVANVLEYDDEESGFELQKGYYVYFQTNTLEIGMKLLILHLGVR